MSLSNKWVIQRIFDMRLKDVSTNKLLTLINDLKTCNIQNAQEDVYSMGGAGNAYITAHSHSKRMTGEASAAVFYNDVIGYITGTDTVTGATTYPWFEVLTVGTNAATTTYTATGTAGAEIGTIYVYNTDGSFGTAYQQMTGTVTTGKFTYTSGTKAIAFFSGDLPAGTQIAVAYNVTTSATATTVTNNTNAFSKIVKIELVSLVQDACTGIEYPATITIPKAKLKGEFAMDLAADGDPAVFNLSFEALKASCTNPELWDLKVIETSGLS